jgi:hypothetical protein
MDIAKLSMDAAQQSVMDAVGMAMLSKSLDTSRMNADGLARLMASADPARAPLPDGAGNRVDILA